MAHTQSTRKRIRQDVKRHLRNQSVKTRIKGLTKKFRAAAGESDAGETNQTLKDTIRALDKAAGAGSGADFEDVVYEGYGPKGVAIVIECMTDNKNRTVSDVRHALTRFGGHGFHPRKVLSTLDGTDRCTR